jgi:hypothetical protein
MECRFEIKVTEPKNDDELFPPDVKFHFEQFNFSIPCTTEIEINDEVNAIIAEVEKGRKQAKEKLKDAQKRHDKRIEKKIGVGKR